MTEQLPHPVLGDRFTDAFGLDELYLDHCGTNAYSLGMKTRVSEKGQITIPKAVRTKLGLRPGTVLEIEAERGRLVGRKASGREIVDELYGSLPLDESVDDYLERARGR